jgi:hypothetical protein
VHYLGSSADLAALRRSLEARGAVSRSRLTPSVTAVVADSTAPADHPTLVTAHELGIEVYDVPRAMDQLLAVPIRRAARTVPLPVASTPLITVTVLVLAGVLALLGVVAALADDSPGPTTVREVSESR